MQTSPLGRAVYILAVSAGVIKYALPGDTAWTATTNNTGETPPLVYSGLVGSLSLNQKQYFFDGTNYVYFDPTDGSVNLWEATSGTLPVDSAGNTARLGCTWRGKPVLSGLLLDPQNIFWGATGTAVDWEYGGQHIDGAAELTTTPTQAVAANLAPFGLIGDVVTSLCPYTDDLLITFCDSHIYMVRGDPADGGKVDLISDTIGGAFGVCWAKDPYGVVYFFSNKMGIYKMIPGSAPQRISQQIEKLVVDVDTGANSLRMAWDDRYQGLSLFVTPLDAPHDGTVHLVYEQRANAWFSLGFANKNHNPLCVCTLDGNLPTDRVVAIGSWDGFVRIIDPTATRDDGYDIESEVVIGPILTETMDDVMLREMQSVLASDSGDVTYGIYLGKTAEEALGSSPVTTGVFSAGRGPNNHLMWAAHAIYIRLTSTNQWAMEQLKLKIETLGAIRQRGF